MREREGEGGMVVAHISDRETQRDRERGRDKKSVRGRKRGRDSGGTDFR